MLSRRRLSGASEVFELGRFAFHADAEACHEDEIGVGAAGDEGVAVVDEEVARFILAEFHLGRGGIGIGQVAGEELAVGFEREETAVETIRAGWREPIVKVGHTAHSTTALPWCQDGS